MTTKDCVKIIDAVIDTPRVKEATKRNILERLEQVFITDSTNFRPDLYWQYINSRLELKQ